MHILEKVCAILKELEGLASEPILENGALNLQNNQSAQLVLTNGKQPKTRECTALVRLS